MSRVTRAAAALIVGGALVPWWAAPAAATTSFTCVSSDADTCVVTVPLTSNMDEQISSTMPDIQPWYANVFGGNCPGGPGAYGVMGQTWDGSDSTGQGHVWAAELTTGTGEGANCNAQITFRHVSQTSTKPVPYKLVTISGPTTATHRGSVTITSKIKPKPPAGHATLQRRHGGVWTQVAALTYSSAHHRWHVKLRWRAAVGTTRTLRVLATATPTLKATHSPSLKIHTTS